jgi:hypothetical protein
LKGVELQRSLDKIPGSVTTMPASPPRSGDPETNRRELRRTENRDRRTFRGNITLKRSAARVNILQSQLNNFFNLD